MPQVQLVLSITHGSVVATSLGIDGLARHLSPGSGKHFAGRSILVDLAVAGGAPAFTFLEEGGWRDAAADATRSLAAVSDGKKTKTAISNGGFAVTPFDAYRSIHVVKAGGQVLTMAAPTVVATWPTAPCSSEAAPADVARAMGATEPERRTLRVYAVLAPVELLVLSNLTPAEYGFYATHRDGKLFRRVAFVELTSDPPHLAASSRYEDARDELAANPRKKTKTVATYGLLDTLPFGDWVGHDGGDDGGLYLADRSRMLRVAFPREIPHDWERAS